MKPPPDSTAADFQSPRQVEARSEPAVVANYDSIEFPRRRAIVLGASNLARGISSVVDTARAAWGAPLDFMAALGHGRSYGSTSRVMGRSLPSILSCGLWDALQQRPEAETAALVTDIGNDIVYGASVETIAAWVEQCLERLAPICKRIVVTELPLASLATLAPWRFRFVRFMMFPQSRLSFEAAMRSAHELNGRVRVLAARYDATLISPRGDWYGIDPIHIKLQHWSGAWREILAAWRDDDQLAPVSTSLAQWLHMRGQRPAERRLFGIHQRRDQPTCRLNDGSLISLY